MQKELMRFAHYFRIFANKSRFKILKILNKATEPVCVGDLAKMGNIPMSKISDQLMVLRKEDLVRSVKKSTKVYYEINREKVKSILDEYMELVKKSTLPVNPTEPAVVFKSLKKITAVATEQEIQYGKVEPARKVIVDAQQVFSALANETRCEAIVRLAEKEQFVNEMCEKFYLEQPTVSLHLNMLKKVGLVDSDKRSLKVFYNVKLDTLKEALESFLK